MPTKILLVDDHPLFRKGLRLLIEGETDMQVVGEAGNGREAIDRAGACSPDVVVMDITMPDMNGIEATRKIVADFPHIKVIALSIHAEKEFVQKMLQAGAAGYVLKDSVPEEITGSIRTVMRDKVYLSDSITGIVVSEYVNVLSKAAKSDEEPVQESGELMFLRTKLHRAHLTPDLISRTHLIDTIDDLRRRPFTLVSAAAGYGKSTTASLWLKAWNRPCGWVSLDENENDLRNFMTYLLAAIQSSHGAGFDKACDRTQSLIKAPSLPPIRTLFECLLNDLDKIDTPFILVLDDYHKISDPNVHELMSGIFKHPTRSMHLMLLTRFDPPLPVSELRGRGLMNEIGISQLRFTVEETALFLKRNLGLSIDETTATFIQDRLEGWAAGMRLMTHSLGNRKDMKHLLAGLQGGFSSIVEYLMTEVLTLQSAKMARFMVETAILNRFCASLCDAICGRDTEPDNGGTNNDGIDGETFIAHLKKKNLFLIPLDAKGRWFRYHHLFQDLLRGQLNRYGGSEEIAGIHHRASLWFEEHELIEEALLHSIAAGDSESTGRFVAKHGHQLIDKERISDLEKWLSKLPGDVIGHNPMLLLFKAWMARINVQLPKIAEYLNRAEALMRTNRPEEAVTDTMWGYLNAIRSYERYGMLDHEEAQVCAKRAITLIPPENRYLRGFAMIIHAATLQMTGRFQKAVSIMKSALADPSLQRSHNQAVLLAGHSPICMMEADFHAMRKAATRLLRLGKKTGLPAYRGWGRLYLACCHYQCNELEAAERTLASHMEDCYLVYPDVVADGAVLLSLSYQGLNHTQEARDVADLLNEYAMKTGNTSLMQTGKAFQAELALRQGRMTEAISWAQRFEPRHLQAHYFFYLPELTAARVLAADDTPASRQRAQNILADLEAFSRATHNRLILIPVLALQAILLDKQADADSALERSAEAVSLAEPGGGFRSFLELGPPMAELLNRLQKENEDTVFIDEILAAFTDMESISPRPDLRSTNDEQVVAPVSAAPSLTFAGQSPRPSTPSQPLVEPLTNRELDVLELLAKRLQNKEIAEKLFVSNQTVKTHLKNIYQKLSVSTRRQAVTQACRLGIITRR